MRIGSGAGFAGDRIGPAVELAERGGLDDLVLECLAERTIAAGQLRRIRDPRHGYDPLLRRRLEALLPITAPQGTRMITNMGAANPLAAGHLARDIAVERGLSLRVGVVTGDDVLEDIDLEAPALEDGRPLGEHGEVISANAYLGADAIMPALTGGADLVITGRVADPSLFLAPLAERLGWDLEDWQLAARGTMIGHLLECAGQITGGYFADPGHKDVSGLARLGFPFADVTADGSAEISKLADTGGMVTRSTVREQLLYEVTDPSAYLTPDVRLDLRQASVREVGTDRVAVEGAVGRPRPDQLKVSVGYHAGFRSEAEISYVGPNALARARLAGEIVAERLRGVGVDVRLDVVGSIGIDARGTEDLRDHECRLRVAALGDRAQADDVCHEVEALYTNGPAGGGGVRTSVTEVIGIVSTYIPRAAVTPRVTLLETGEANASA
ncbi:acyclic terpene utilization AtuA family protein [Nocardioides sp. NPDC057577]|uniref:acyclic terpene utilization AtuA family protein n=1 Tax=Nocardioides sp. NPDC057577 TaxID=3346171 RepID=UPI0036710F98